MPTRLVILGAAHVHAPSFAAAFLADPRAQVTGVWDHDAARGQAFAEERGLAFIADLDEALKGADAAVICSENMRHAELIEAAVAADLHVLCEKPIAANGEQAERIEKAAAASDKVMATAFPCPFSPAFAQVLARVQSGDMGRILAISATNRGTCPGGWFTQPEHSGGGAMIDHVVHAADLIRRLMGGEALAASATVGSGMYGEEWEDTAHVMIELPGGAFATIDSSWSRPKGWRTWGDLTLRVTCDNGVLEADLFGQGPHQTRAEGFRHLGVGANLDALMTADFLTAIETGAPPRSSLADGLAASRVALAAYASLSSGEFSAA